MLHSLEQRTEDWYKVREGRFTASQISRLLGKEGLKRTIDSMDSYAFEKAVETIYGREEEDYISNDMQRGITLEPLAFKLFKDLKGYEFVDVNQTGFHKHGKHAGASPDGLTSDNSVLEIKCPRRNKFYKLVANGISEVDKSYIAQMQMQMMCTDTGQAYFLNYYIDNGIQHWHELIVPRDKDMISLIKERIEEATEIKLAYIKKIQENTQF
ncbi:lambda exonuclease family protein [uncultured Winogradskyella sp.]|uniref:lambda exonuclease family protein n=1 Tax=uncultured Winogradskyella sp. TaxID=395353 RepID=UPI00260865E6|nr:lambda exonuclease family protein [uncultured Winogradskyella sp.]